MGRKAVFAREELLTVAAREAASGRKVTIETLAAASGAPVGSIYHRFDSREQLLAEAWLHAVAKFHEAFLPALAGARSIDEGVEAALAVPRWSRANLTLAGLLALRRQRDFLGEDTPALLRREAARINKAVAVELEGFAARTKRSLTQCRVALVGAPYGAVRLFLPESAPPPEVDAMIAASYRAVMATSSRRTV